MSALPGQWAYDNAAPVDLPDGLLCEECACVLEPADEDTHLPHYIAWCARRRHSDIAHLCERCGNEELERMADEEDMQ